MDPEIKHIEELSEENNRMLKKLVTDLRWRRIISYVKWIVIIGVALGAYYYLEPYLQKTVEIYNQISGGIIKPETLPSLKEFIKNL